ncbi:MAG TPA: gliding motility-associated ABC transporter substrate-binding protein GldG [Flavobacteriaceae bacterium]|nr:gliding motility-associated ABC transporter substrate-binding protein GldG [Flavobacteriaceae bacterium]
MPAIFKKEINAFFSSILGYLVIAVFLLVNGLFLWVFEGQFNIFNFGFANLSPFFLLAPWIFIFLIPAITMRSFSEEKKQGTLELLFTKPIPLKNLILGKYFGNFALVVLALVPTLLYVLTIHQLGDPVGNFDLGATLGSYLGLLFLAACYTAIGIFASTVSQNQLVAFILAVFLCFLAFFGFEGISEIGIFGSEIYGLEYLGISFHYESISRGVLDTRDIIYFLSIVVLFLYFTKLSLEKNIKSTSKKSLSPIFIPLILVAINVVASMFFERFDWTDDNRYTLSPAAVEIVEKVESPIVVTVFLTGDLPSEFNRLQLETKRILEEFAAYNPQIKFEFVDPLAEGGDAMKIATQFYELGMIPENLNVRENGKLSTRIIFPWAVANYRNETAKIHLLKKKISNTNEEMVNNSIQNLEYAFADAFSKLVSSREKTIAVMRGNGELPDGNIASFIKSLQAYYKIAPFTLDSAAVSPRKTLEQLSHYDLIIEAKPTEAYTEKEKYILDQYLMRGGKALWMLETVSAEKDSLFANENNQALAYPIDLNLRDFFFKYGVRINPVLVNTLQSAPIVLASGQGNNIQFTPFPWVYSPLAISENNHPITNNISAVKFDFANSIDTLENSVEKTVLLKSAPQSKAQGTPLLISLELLKEKPDFKTYNEGQQVLAVLLEGTFTSVYKNRIKPFEIENHKDQSQPTKMVVISDGDVIKNQLKANEPVPLGFDRFTGNTYGNQEFLLNTVNYLLDDTGLINIRSKELSLAFLDSEKVIDQRLKWQLINLVLPLVVLGIFGWAFTYFRSRKYVRS